VILFEANEFDAELACAFAHEPRMRRTVVDDRDVKGPRVVSAESAVTPRHRAPG
jgi:hypothetical protein